MAEGGATESKVSVPPDGYVDVLDGLRGIAIFLVVLFHVWQFSWLNLPALPNTSIRLTFIPAAGFLGVDLFFFVSAFCLTLPYARHHFEGTREPTAPRFFLRRAAKILPSYYLAIFVILVFFGDRDIPPNRLWFHLTTHLVFAHNVVFETCQSINGVLWSLAVEVQFYLIFPLLIRTFRRWPLATLCGMAAVAQCWRGLTYQWYQADNDAVLFAHNDHHLLGRLDLFAAGMAAGWVYVHLKQRDVMARRSLFCSSLAGLALAAFSGALWLCFHTPHSPHSITLWQLQFRLPLSALFFVMGVTAPFAGRSFRAALANPLLRGLSFISYNLYIWHQWIALKMLQHRIPLPKTADPHDDPEWKIAYTAGAWTVSIVVAFLVTWLWERPFLRGTIPWKRRSAQTDGFPPASVSDRP